MKNILLLIGILLVLLVKVKGQLMIEQGPSGSTRDGSLIVYGLTGSGNRLPYEKIKGSPFLNDEWRNATLFHSSGKAFGVYQTRLNLATQEVHYKDAKGNELVDDGSIARVVFEEAVPDGIVYTSFFGDLAEINRNYNVPRKYTQELNAGNIALLKVCTRTVSQGDSLFGTLKRYYFVDKYDYYLRVNKKIERLKRLSEDDISPFIPGYSSLRTWIRSNKLRLNREEDCVKLLLQVNKERSSGQ